MNKKSRSERRKGPSGRWSSRSLAPELFHRIFYGTIRLAGQRAAYCLLFFVVSFYCLIPKVRDRARPYLEKRFYSSKGVALFLHTFRLYWNFGCMLVDRSVLRILGRFHAEGSDEDKNMLRSLYEKHGKLILLTAHAGCWQMGISFLDFVDAPKAVVMLMENGNVDRHAFRIKPSGPAEGESAKGEITIINPAGPLGGSIEMLNALNHGSVLCINADRIFGSDKHSVGTDFFGGRIKLPISAYKLAASTGAPVAIVFSARTGPGAGRFWVADVLHIPSGVDKGEIRGPEAFTPFAENFAKQMEKFCQKYPWQFYNFYNMWN